MQPILEARELGCAYGRRNVFAGVDLGVRPGEVLALIGPNGAGKTTLLRALAGLLRPRQGRVWLDGAPLEAMRPRRVARRLAFAPQLGPAGSLLSVEQMVALGRAPHRGWLLPFTTGDRAVVERTLERLGLAGLRGRAAGELSGGEQRRVIIARALAQQPAVLLLDEPTAHLDLKYQLEILELVRELARRDGLAVVLTLHDLNQAAFCADRVALLARGRLQAAGAPAEVISPAAIEAAYEVPVLLVPHPLGGPPLLALPPSERIKDKG
ncbi:MAG TPA: ABC transporter ATP-binding protein [Herpetosiphonaceae bacterium]|nr:ABC transporter ATP-binding protein [Herpetosiphonaceae bacterium]